MSKVEVEAASSWSRQAKAFATVWPEIRAWDSDSLRQRKLAVRTGHTAMAAMVVAAVGGSQLMYTDYYGIGQIIGLWVLSVCYVLWNLVGTRGVVRLVLWDGEALPLESTRQPPFGTTVYFVVQVCLATLLYGVADRGLMPNLIWLALLPPVAYSVFMLEWRGITVISLAMVTVLVSSACRWHGWGFIGYASLAFSFAVLFTIVFALLAVQSEKARNEVQRLAGELRQANRQLGEYAVQAEELSSARERNQIAREIHDSLGHYLAVANMQLQAAQALWGVEPARARDAVSKAQSFTQEGMQDIRQSVASLRQSPLENRSLGEALRQLTMHNDWSAGRVEFQLMGAPRRLSPPAELSLYRAGQEGLTNARKHSQGRNTKLVLDFRTTGNVSVSVIDDGIGADQAVMTTGFGLLGLRERAQLLGGRLKIETGVGRGFALTFEVPG